MARKETAGGLSDLHLENRPVTMESISNVKAFPCETLDAAGQRALQNAHKRLLFEAAKQPLGTEVGRCYGLDMRPLCDTMIGDSKASQIRLPDYSGPYIAVHNHPDCQIFSESDIALWLKRPNMRIITAIGNNGHIFRLKTTKFDLLAAQDIFDTWKTPEINRFSSVNAYIKAMEKLLERLTDYGAQAYT